MIAYAWVLVGLWIISMIFAPLGIGKERTVGDTVVNILYHIVALAFVGIFLVTHYLGGV